MVAAYHISDLAKALYLFCSPLAKANGNDSICTKLKSFQNKECLYQTGGSTRNYSMKYFSLLFVVVIYCSVGSCNKEALPGSISIIGKWRWVKTTGGFAGRTTTPQSTGYTQRYLFNADSTFKNFKNDSLSSQGKFSLVKGYKHGDQTYDVIKTGKGYDQSYVVRNDTLFLNDTFISDGFFSTYVRLK